MAAFYYLDPYRPNESISMGMAGGLSVPRLIPLNTFRDEGQRRGYRGEALEDFVEILRCADNHYIGIATKRIAADTKAAAARAKKN